VSYYKFKDGGSFETFFFDGATSRMQSTAVAGIEPGWYWWACFPGCLPDGEPSGPFKTEQDAIDDAQRGL